MKTSAQLVLAGTCSRSYQITSLEYRVFKEAVRGFPIQRLEALQAVIDIDWKIFRGSQKELLSRQPKS